MLALLISQTLAVTLAQQVPDQTPLTLVGPCAGGFCYSVPAPPAPRSPFGINLAGCAVGADGALCPDADEVKWWTGQGFGIVRLAFKDTTPIARVHASADLVLAAGGTLILDRHDFKWPSVADQVAFWTAAAAKYRNDPRVLIDLMNEPKGFDDPAVPNDYVQWARDTRLILAELRKAGFGNTILVEWPGSSASFRFDKAERVTASYVKPCESAACALDRQGGLGDGNVILSPHRYFDPGSPGASSKCTTDVAAELASTRAKAAKRGYRLFLGESAFGNWVGMNGTCAAEGAKVIAEIKSHPETWAGVTWWGAGREWPVNYVFAAGPKGQRNRGTYVRTLTGETPVQ